MSHWAEIDENNIVLRVLVGDNNDLDEGYQWLIDNLGGTWVKTSFNTHGGVHALGGTPLRKNFAGIGMEYDEKRDAFIWPKPEPYIRPIDGVLLKDFVFDEEKGRWEVVPVPLEENNT